MTELNCACCGMVIYDYAEDQCELCGIICFDCAKECHGCGSKGCHDERSGRGCLIEHDWGWFCDMGHVEEYAQEKGLKLADN